MPWNGKLGLRDNEMVKLLRVIRLMAVLSAACAFGQSINSGTVSGQVADPSGALIAGAKVRLTNPVTGFEQMVVTDTSGTFRFNSVPVNNYHLEVSSSGFNTVQQNVDVRNSVPVVANIALNIATEASTVTVQATAAAVETDTAAHQDVDSSAFSKLPVFSPGAGLSDAITYSTGAVAADANGFFHPLGDHAQTTFVIDGQPMSDQQSKLFSTQIPLNALQGMELITGSPDAQYGDKTSLVVNATTRSGLGATKPFGSYRFQLGIVWHVVRKRHPGIRQRRISETSWRLMSAVPATFWTRRNFCPSTTSAITGVSLIASTGSPARRTSSIWICSPRGTGFRSPTATIN